MTDLQPLFVSVCDSLGVQSGGYFEILDDLYRGRLRFYHNWDHIESVLDRIDLLSRHVSDNREHWLNLTRFAAFYHDAIYVPGFAENEHISGLLATSHLSAGGRSELCATVYGWIAATKDHRPSQDDFCAMVLCDADLYELGTPSYGMNGLNVRREFGAFDDHEWRVGRSAFLTEYGGRERLYSLPGQDQLEFIAKAQMGWELMSLDGLLDEEIS